MHQKASSFDGTSCRAFHGLVPPVTPRNIAFVQKASAELKINGDILERVAVSILFPTFFSN